MVTPELRDEDLDEIERRVNGATPGPWFTRILSDEYANAITAVTTKQPKLNDPPEYFDPSEVVSITFLDGPAYATREIREADRNASFIAHARVDLVRLIEEIRRLRSEM
jgi:hypothetical protein